MEVEIENKAIEPAGQGTLKGFEEVMRTFEAYKETNDVRLEELEARHAADPLTEEKLARIDAVLDSQQELLGELGIKGALVQSAEADERELEHKSAFESYVRKGDVTALAGLEQKALSVGSEADGGYLVPDKAEHTIMQALEDESPIRKISGSISISTGLYKRPFAISGASAGWVGETGGRPQTATPTLAELSFPTMELYAMPAATLKLLDDAAVNIETWIASEVRESFAEHEGQAFVSGDGVNKPKGFLSYGTVPNDSWSWGQLGYIATGAAADFAATNPSDALIDLVYALKSKYRRGARFVMNRLTQSAIRKLKDADGNYLWQPSLGAALEPNLLGYPVSECEDMPDIDADSLSLAFGDFSRGYLIVDRAGIRVLRDPFTAKPYVLLYTTKRVGGGMQDFNAIKLLKFAVS